MQPLFSQTLCQELDPGVLWFLRNPNDPAFQPVREMVELSVMQHVRRIALSAIMYGCLILFFVYLPVRMSCSGGIFPLRMVFRYPPLPFTAAFPALQSTL